MAAFAIITSKPDTVLAGTIASKYPDGSYALADNAWLVADTNKTTQEVCEKLNIKPSASIAVVLKVDSYFGAAVPTIWEWLKVKGAGP